MEAKHFASCCPLSVWKREVSLLLLTQCILYIYMCCGNGSETFRFLLPIGCMVARSFAFFTNTKYIVHMCCGNGSETFRFLLPIGCMEARSFAFFTNTKYIVHIYVLWEWKRNISLLVAH